MKKIIEIPHESLRATAKPVTKVDKKLIKFISELEETLVKKRNPRGVGLAATQVDVLLRVFCLNISRPKIYINPEIIKTSAQKTLGPKEDDPIMEGCLSMPQIYGPVPRWEWVEVSYQTISENKKLETHTERLHAFEARVFQHELDHLNGILFTDHSLEYDLPVYKEISKDNYEEVPREFLSAF